MFDVYLSDKHDLLVVRKGLPIPLVGTLGRWRKRKKKVLKVGDEIKSTVQRQGSRRPGACGFGLKRKAASRRSESGLRSLTLPVVTPENSPLRPLADRIATTAHSRHRAAARRRGWPPRMPH